MPLGNNDVCNLIMKLGGVSKITDEKGGNALNTAMAAYFSSPSFLFKS